MNIEEMQAFSNKCFRDTKAPCELKCPFDLDIRKMIDRVKRESFTASYREYRSKVLFPHIVSSLCNEYCKQGCIMGREDSIDLRSIEKYCVEHTKDAHPTSFTVPKKDERVAVIGGGVSGLACVMKLASRGYQTTLYERNSQIGGSVNVLLDEELVQGEFQNEFSKLKYELFLNKEIKSLSEIEADAIYIATGKSGEDFGLGDGVDIDSLASKTKGVFIGGEVIGSDVIWAIENGIRASLSIERYLKTGSMNSSPEIIERGQDAQKYLEIALLDGHDESADHKIHETPLEEAKRCLLCNCSSCMDSCDVLQHFRNYPKRISMDVEGCLRAIDGLTKRKGLRLINSCTLCGLCGKVCTEQISVDKLILNARRKLFEKDDLPKPFHEFWLDDMAQSMSEEAYLAYRPDESKESRTMFFPGCQLSASSPGIVKRTYEYLLEKDENCGLILGCCGVPADWAGDEALKDETIRKLEHDWKSMGKPKILYACATCGRTFHNYFPQADKESLYEYMAGFKTDFPKVTPRDAVVFDSCASRDDPEMQRGVRQLAESVGLNLRELKYNGEKAECCGFGGHIYPANPELADKIVKNRIGRDEREYVVYCSNCRDVFKSQGKECTHILDILFQEQGGYCEPKELSERRQNRIRIKCQINNTKPDFNSENVDERDGLRLNISPDILKKMNRLLLLREDIKRTIIYCETSENKLEDKKGGYYIGHLKKGSITIWVTYRKIKQNDDFVYDLINVYAHRLELIEKSESAI